MIRRLDDGLVVGGDDQGRAGLDEVAHRRDEGLPGGGVELGGGLVGEQDERSSDGGGRERDPLLLAAGELGREGACVRGHADDIEELGRRPAGRRRGSGRPARPARWP